MMEMNGTLVLLIVVMCLVGFMSAFSSLLVYFG